MKKLKTLLFYFFALVCLPTYGQVSFGQPEKINDNWRFDLGDAKNAQSITFDDNKWELINLPHDWSVKGQLSPTLASCTGYLPGGIGWYRKNINIPQSKQGDKIFIYFEGVYNRSEVYINGHLLGKRPNGYVSFMYDITPYVEYGKDNVIAVRADHSQFADSRWYTGSGIYRDVWLVYANPVHIDQWGVFWQVKTLDKNKAVLAIETEINNETTAKSDLTVINQLLTAEGKEVAKSSKKIAAVSNGKSKISQDLNVAKPIRWDLENPYLYTLKTTVIRDGKTIDETTTNVGIRTYTFDPDKGFALNGEWMKVKGLCIHHDAGVLGAAVPPEVWERRLIALKALGCNALRMTHNPQAPELYDLCDRMGFLVIDEAFDEWEFAKRKWLEGWNKGTPGFDGAYDFFEEWGERDLADVVRRDRNHTSIFAWSIGNEVDYPNDPYSHPVLDGSSISQPTYGGYKKDAPNAERLGVIAKKLAAVVREYDTSRPVTGGLAGVSMSNETEYPGILDIAGYNYTEDRYDADHKTYPKHVIYGSENRHDMEAWKAVRDNEHIFGQFLWTGIDYLGESGSWPSRGFYTGLLDFGGFIKPRGHFRQALWTSTPTAYIGTYVISKDNNNNRNYISQDAWPIWNYENGQNVRVVCYTNTPQAKLLLDGKEVGQTKNYDDNTGIIYWDIPFQKGKLEVVGINADGKEVCTYSIQSSDSPYALTIQTGKSEIDKNKGLAQVVVQVVDRNGIPVMISDDEVTCTIDGPAQLLGLEASNNRDMSDYTDNVHRVHHGRILAYVQATGEKGQAKVKFTAPWLQPAEIVINVK